MSEQLTRFNRNMERVDGLCTLFERVKETRKRPTVKEGDILRAAVVFLHSALEDYLRGILAEWLPTKGDKDAIDGIALLNCANRPEKFFLGTLLNYSNMPVGELIARSVRQYMFRVSFNDMSDIIQWIKKIGLSLDSFHDQGSVNTMINRRHRIVHETDANQDSGHGNHYAASINIPTVKAWKTVVTNMVNELEQQIASWS